ncbi:Metallo-hydrolase/oxidoreductase [Dacryopinax primogenitus]|uniref:Endoribonuclease YSH1 n=1 Tax=Dacryopinax primogenitus (strain DJM 731) TaxID=1858805 RepID=M5FPU8_DACPD|nr:Metallo-hydrolase/oxidoreductase [Dacryopinax primogenitus]EJT97328.1 Metallo-hydrolase/oxidoreductase [Dacryopinax primogenitus]
MATSLTEPKLSITLLGAGQEVGRSCCVIQHAGITVVCDAGVHPAFHGMAALPFIDDLDWSTVDALLITHFHLDHAASLTYIMEKTNFKDGKGKVYMTHPTKAVYRLMMQDYVRMSAAQSTSAPPLFTPLDLSITLPLINAVSFATTTTVIPGLSFTPYPAGHVLGASMFLIQLADLRILYTGDYSREESRHLVRAEVPPGAGIDVLIIESTFGVQSTEGRREKEERFTSLIHRILMRGGHVLMPVFAVGGAQELLLILDDFFEKHPELHKFPIYYASALARKCMAVYQGYVHVMNNNIRQRFANNQNPFVFRHVSHIPRSSGWEKKIGEGPPCVILASPGMMQSGASRELLEMWAPDRRNGIVLTGYSVEGSMARNIMNEPDEINAMKGTPIPLRCTVDNISFSAHVDYAQNREFIEAIGAPHVVLVHGEQSQMFRLKAALQAGYKERNEHITIHTPKNCETLELIFRGERVAKAIGTLAEHAPQAGAQLSGLLVSKDFTYTLLDPRDLRDFTGLSTSTIVQKQRLCIPGLTWELVKWHLEGLFGSVTEGVDAEGTRTMRAMGLLDVKGMRDAVKEEPTISQEENGFPGGYIVLEWVSSGSNDMIADAAMALIHGIDASPASVKLTSRRHIHADHVHEKEVPKAAANRRLTQLIEFLELYFGQVQFLDAQGKEMDEDEDEEGLELTEPALRIRLDEQYADINLITMTVKSASQTFRRRIEDVLAMALTTYGSLTESYISADRSGWDGEQDFFIDGEARENEVSKEMEQVSKEGVEARMKE